MASVKGMFLFLCIVASVTKNLNATVSLVPHTKGNDFCGTNYDGGYHYIIRSDLGVFMRAGSLTGSPSTKIYKLCEACKGADHYLAIPGGKYYIIKGNQYRKNRGLESDRDSRVYNLHPNCRGGKHYFGGTDHHKYIIFSDNTYRRVVDMTHDSQARTFKLHPNCQGGLYYWAREGWKYFVKQGHWGIEYHRVSDLTRDLLHTSYSVAKPVIGFLPGGLAVNYGPVYGQWTLIKSFRNPSSSDVEYKKTITKKVGYNKQKLSSTEHSWSISASVTTSAGALTESIAKTQMTLTAAYGGLKIDTTTQDWSKETETTEEITITLKAGQSVYFWQYQIGLGTDTGHPVLFGKNLVTNNSGRPPKEPGYTTKA
ncbi:uncharacterized protein [Clytia hemisphaerica]|uniref:Uncharacterized protein n=1 Tax=Clytia hemisphaerica TaxID=252671 RepID=A0A7M5VF43_9CNID